MKLSPILGLVVVLIFAYCLKTNRMVEGEQMRKIDTIVVHHSATPPDTTVFSIANYHIGKGWRAVGYHYLITPDGQIWGKGHREFMGMRRLSYIGAHAKGRNEGSIGICLMGMDDFSDKQKLALHDLCETLIQDFSIVSIERHHEECPGKGMDVEELEKEIFTGK